MDLVGKWPVGFVVDFLLEQRRPAEVVALLKRWSRSDTLLLRLAIAARALGLPEPAWCAPEVRAILHGGVTQAALQKREHAWILLVALDDVAVERVPVLNLRDSLLAQRDAGFLACDAGRFALR